MILCIPCKLQGEALRNTNVCYCRVSHAMPWSSKYSAKEERRGTEKEIERKKNLRNEKMSTMPVILQVLVYCHSINVWRSRQHILQYGKLCELLLFSFCSATPSSASAATKVEYKFHSRYMKSFHVECFCRSSTPRCTSFSHFLVVPSAFFRFSFAFSLILLILFPDLTLPSSYFVSPALCACDDSAAMKPIFRVSAYIQAILHQLSINIRHPYAKEWMLHVIHWIIWNCNV